MKVLECNENSEILIETNTSDGHDIQWTNAPTDIEFLVGHEVSSLTILQFQLLSTAWVCPELLDKLLNIELN